MSRPSEGIGIREALHQPEQWKGGRACLLNRGGLQAESSGLHLSELCRTSIRTALP